MLSFDPDERITVFEALEHPWLASYHDVTDEPECKQPFDAWRYIETLETMDDFRNALWKEIQEYRQEVRGVNDLSGMPIRTVSGSRGTDVEKRVSGVHEHPEHPEAEIIVEEAASEGQPTTLTEEPDELEPEAVKLATEDSYLPPPPSSQNNRWSAPVTPTDPVVTYARRSSIMQAPRQGSTFNTPFPSSQHIPSYSESSTASSSVAFPSRGEGYVLPARSRTGSIAGGEVTRRLLRTLSTVSIYESGEGLAGGLADLAPIGRYIVDRQTTEADAPASEMPREFGINEADEDAWDEKVRKRERKEGKFFVGDGQKPTSSSQNPTPNLTASRSHSQSALDTSPEPNRSGGNELQSPTHSPKEKKAPVVKKLSVQSLEQALAEAVTDEQPKSGEASTSRRRFLIE